MYNCARCHRQVLVCRHCDRGHIYCFDGCAAIAHGESSRRASKRYGATRRGRHANAERQRRFRERQREKVTHHGSGVRGTFAVVLRVLSGAGREPKSTHHGLEQGIFCHRCHRQCSAFLRRAFLQQVRRADEQAGRGGVAFD